MRTTKWIAAGAATVMVAAGATVVSAQNPAPETWAFVARGDNPVDALGAAPLAGRLDAPVILTEQSTLTVDALSALTSADPDNVVIAGGLGAIAQTVEDAIRAALPDAEITRVAGETRYQTSALLAALFDDIDPSFLASNGVANAALTAEDAEALGGVPAEAFRSSVSDTVVAIGEGETITHASGQNQPLTDILEPRVFTAPVDGVLHVDASLLQESLNQSEQALLTIDLPAQDAAPDGQTRDEQIALFLAAYNGVLDARLDPDGYFSLSGARFLEAGQTVTVSLLSSGPDTSADGPDGAGAVDEAWRRRSLTLSFLPGEGSFDPLTVDEVPTVRNGDRQLGAFLDD